MGITSESKHLLKLYDDYIYAISLNMHLCYHSKFVHEYYQNQNVQNKVVYLYFNQWVSIYHCDTDIRWDYLWPKYCTSGGLQQEVQINLLNRLHCPVNNTLHRLNTAIHSYKKKRFVLQNILVGCTRSMDACNKIFKWYKNKGQEWPIQKCMKP